MTQATEDRLIRLDRMRYVKNTDSSRLCYLAILANVLYFVSIYKSDVASWYYQILVGGSIVYNLLFMLIVFLASEGVKNYQKKYSWLLYGLGIFQIVRIFILPTQAHQAEVEIGGTMTLAMGDGQYLRVLLYLAASYKGQGKVKEAVVTYHRAYLFEVELAYAHYEMAQLYSQFGLEKEHKEQMERASALSERRLHE